MRVASLRVALVCRKGVDRGSIMAALRALPPCLIFLDETSRHFLLFLFSVSKTSEKEGKHEEAKERHADRQSEIKKENKNDPNKTLKKRGSHACERHWRDR